MKLQMFGWVVVMLMAMSTAYYTDNAVVDEEDDDDNGPYHLDLAKYFNDEADISDDAPVTVRDVPVGSEPNAYAKITSESAAGAVGEVDFRWDTVNGCMQIVGTIANLKPGYHGFHIHKLGDLRTGCKSAGGHYNPDGVNHAGPTNSTQHVGDLGNILAGNDGKANVDICVPFVRTSGAKSVIGRGVVVHKKRDDLGGVDNEGSRKTGNAGPRVGCGTIGYAK